MRRVQRALSARMCDTRAMASHLLTPMTCMRQVGGTALMYAAAYGHTRLVDLLLSRGADARVKDAVRARARVRWPAWLDIDVA